MVEPSLAESSTRQRLAAILAADVSGYSRLMACDEAGTVSALDAAREVFARHIVAQTGRVVDMAGDSVLALFETAAGAVNAALAVQDEIAERSAGQAEDCRMRFRIGIHLGDVIEKADGTIYGDGVNTAARLESLADAGGVCVSDTVECAVRHRVPARFEDLGEKTLKNLAKPVRAYRMHRALPARPAPPDTPAAVPPEPGYKPSIAVLPFANMSGDAGAGVLRRRHHRGHHHRAVALSRAVRDLAQLVLQATRASRCEVQKVARELGVQYVVEGSVRKAGNRVRITAQLIDADTDRHVWAERYDRDLEDIFAIQDEVTVVDRRHAAGPRRGGVARPRGAQDHRQHGGLRMRAHRQATAPPQQPRRQRSARRQLLDRAIALDPNYAHAHAWKACTLGQCWGYNWCQDRKALEPVIVAELETALALDDNDSDVHRILAAVNLVYENFDLCLLPPAARAEPEPERRPGGGAARRDPDLVRPGRRRHRLDRQGDAPEPLPPRALLEPPGPCLLRRAPLCRRAGRGEAHRARRTASLHGLHRRLRGPARRSAGAQTRVREMLARFTALRPGRVPGQPALPARGRP